jgi:hypothetical protein
MRVRSDVHVDAAPPAASPTPFAAISISARSRGRGPSDVRPAVATVFPRRRLRAPERLSRRGNCASRRLWEMARTQVSPGTDAELGIRVPRVVNCRICRQHCRGTRMSVAVMPRLTTAGPKGGDWSSTCTRRVLPGGVRRRDPAPHRLRASRQTHNRANDSEHPSRLRYRGSAIGTTPGCVRKRRCGSRGHKRPSSAAADFFGASPAERARDCGWTRSTSR